MKTNIRNAAWAIGVLLLAGFCLVGCDRRLDVRTVYPFQVTTMPIPKTIAPGEEVEIRCTLASERIVKGTRYTLRYFQYDGSGALRIGRRGKSLTPNDRYAVSPGNFMLYYRSLSAERQLLEVVIEDNHGQSQTLDFDFNIKEVGSGQPTLYLAHGHRRPEICFRKKERAVDDEQLASEKK